MQTLFYLSLFFVLFFFFTTKYANNSEADV